MFFIFSFFFLVLESIIFASSPSTQKELPFVIIVPSYNNTDWVEKNLKSILTQNYSNYRIIYINDNSTDETLKQVKLIALSHLQKTGLLFKELSPQETKQFQVKQTGKNKPKKPFFTLINNQKRKGALCNIYKGVSLCEDKEIIALLDGDDWLYDNNVLSKLNKIYQETSVWLTHGNLLEYPYGGATWGEPIPPSIIRQNAFREFKCPSHLRTFYAWLFKKIKLEDLMYQGDFFEMTSDQAIMFPMIEMAGDRHLFIEEVLYVYNMKNPINDNKIDPQKQRDLEAIIRSAPPYKRLEAAPNLN